MMDDVRRSAEIVVRTFDAWGGRIFQEPIGPYVEALAVAIDRLRTDLGGDQLLQAVPARVGCDEEDGLLTEGAREPLSDRLGALEDGVTARADRRGEDLDHEAVLAGTLPDAARLEVGRSGEDLADELLDLRGEGAAVEGGGKLLVASGRARDAGADVEPDGAARLEIAPRGARAVRHGRSSPAGSSSGHEQSVPEGVQVMKDRSPRRANRLWIYTAIDRKSGLATLETSWMPKVDDVSGPLEPLGFRRAADGCYRAELPLQNRLGILRAVTRAFDVMLTEEAER